MTTVEEYRSISNRRWTAIAQDFINALANPLTYSPRKNPEVSFGFLWGIPVPIFAILIHVHASHSGCDLATCLSIVRDDPVYAFFLLHPILFAIIFGALGTMRANREQHIRELLDQSERQCQELCKANARLTELDRWKSEFLANVTHELKSPLVTALGYTDRILGRHLGEITDGQRNGLEVSKRNLRHLRNLIDEILDFSRLDAGVARFEMTPNDFAAAVRSAVEGLALKAKDRNITVIASTPPEPAMVIGDTAKLSQVVVNLVDNAIKFSHDGGTIRIGITADGPHWHLIVADEGVGISPQVLPHLFERFVQEDGSLARNYDGIGLGLVIVKKIVEAHGGRIRIESQPGIGTKVHVELRTAPPATAPTAQETRKETVHV